MHMHITTKVIASVEKHENAGIKFSTVPAFALADSRASDACCLFLVQYEHLPVFSSPGKFRASCAFWLCRLTQRYSHPPRSIRRVTTSWVFDCLRFVLRSIWIPHVLKLLELTTTAVRYAEYAQAQ